MVIDHIFLFSSNKGKEADDLVNFGLVEGSSRRHPGQGTINRKFYFQNFFLEILWVVDQDEIKSPVTSKTKLWERSCFTENENSRYGLCLVNTESTDALFNQSENYQPSYFPKGMSIDIITNENNPQLPWTFRLPFRDEIKVYKEPTEHPNGIKSLTSATFEITETINSDELLNHFKEVPSINFKNSNRTHLLLEFDNKIQGKSMEFTNLGLTFKY